MTLAELLRPLSTSDEHERGSFLSFLSKNGLFWSFLTEYFSDLPLFVLTENSLHAEVAEHHPMHLGLTSQAPRYF